LLGWPETVAHKREEAVEFALLLKQLRNKAKKSRYAVAQYTGLDQAYLLRLETGERKKPSKEAVLMIALGLVQGSMDIDIYDVNELLHAAGYSPLETRGNRLAFNTN